MQVNKLTKNQKQFFVVLGIVTTVLYWLNEYTDSIYYEKRNREREEQIWNEFKENSNAAYIQNPEFRIKLSGQDSLKTDSIIRGIYPSLTNKK